MNKIIEIKGSDQASLVVLHAGDGSLKPDWTDAERAEWRLWWQGPLNCQWCQHRWQAVVPVDDGQASPIVAMECPNCGNFVVAEE